MSYRNEPKGVFLRRKELEFTLNFLKNHDEPIADECIFTPFAKITDKESIALLLTDSAGEALLMKNGMRGLPGFPETETPEPPPFGNGMRRRFVRRQPDSGTLEYECVSASELLRWSWNCPELRDFVNNTLQVIEKQFNEAAPLRNPPEIIERQLAELRKSVSLTETEINLLLAIYLHSNERLSFPSSFDGEFRHPRHRSNTDLPDFLAQCLDIRGEEVRKLLSVNERLRRYGLIASDFSLMIGLDEYLQGISEKPIEERFFKKHTDKPLPWAFYADLAKKHGEPLKRLLASRKDGVPLHILLYGVPGSGKTSFARTLAGELGLDCCFIAQSFRRDDDRPDAPFRHGNGRLSDVEADNAFRFGALQFCDGRVDPARSLIVVDEADRLLACERGGLFSLLKGASDGDKGLLNNVMDGTKTPVIWISNTPAAALDVSSRRRFNYSICFGENTAKQRLFIWKNNVASLGLDSLLDETTLSDFAGKYDVSAGGISIVLKSLAAISPAKSEAPALVETLMRQHLELLGVKIKRDKMEPARDYSLEGLNIKGCDPELIIKAIRRFYSAGKSSGEMDAPRMNILLSGPPGTGKTEFVKYIGKATGRKVTSFSCSDLLSKWLGESEQNIAAAFREAESRDAILFLDEVDSLLRSRAGAWHTWEVTHVNELLQQMENFDGVLVCATNFSRSLDAAASRRFTFKFEFAWLDDAGKRLFFERMFRTTLTEAEASRLSRIANLAPGDFRTARQSLYYLGGEVTNTARLDALERESAAKTNNAFAEKPRIGFA